MSTYTGTPPARITALEQEGKLKLGTMTSSPGLNTKRQDNSNEAVQLGVRKARPPQFSSSHDSAANPLKAPSPLLRQMLLPVLDPETHQVKLLPAIPIPRPISA